MKTGWQTSTLGDVLDVLRNGVNCKQDKSGIGEKISRIESISGAWFDIEKVGYANLSELDKHRYRLKRGDILFSHINSPAHVGKTAIFDCDEPVYHGVNLLLMRPKEVVTSDYLNHALKYLFQSGYWHGVCKQSVNQASVNQQDISKVEISFPKSLPEQHRIVGILDEAFDGIATAKANAEKNLQNARALFESHLQAEFAEAWQVGKLVTLTDLATDITDGDHMPPPKAPSGVPFITIGNIIKDTRTIDFANTFMVPKEYYDGLKPNKKPKIGDVLYTVTGSFGIPVLVSDSLNFCFQRHIGLVRPKSEVDSSWLYYLLMSPQVFKQANDGANGAAQKTVSLKLLRGFEVPKISLTRQLSSVAKLDAIAENTKRLESIYQRKLAKLEELKKSLLHQAFTGQL
ncbi:restriction endonuclease subunit S [Oryzomonas japonica]|uniref:Restriction endonuclease subunit S n=1 Tax=Oryzomonas japonica TaxID=2603858 RepID=A0A7J4ZS22_9BACT|nr:restriction endonuclease subunit S [Oryzomonas japonica]KAB0665757.1 restriction endonuclease subunit S [Oryzomonas japonica]